jgi:glycosyltransferase A (GT-A) superfamily protein (DUF2064 family)
VKARVLVVAKAPVAGLAKTRLAHDVGFERAAELAAASLLDTLRACAAAAGVSGCHVAMTGDLAAAARADELSRALAGWTVHEQHGPDFATRLANAHLAMPVDRPVVQVGMDTPQLLADHLEAAAALTEDHDAVLGPAPDGGWWVLALRDPSRAAPLAGVPMSTPTTYADTRRALEADGLGVGRAEVLRDVDTIEDAENVAALAPDSEFARVWRVGR